MNKREQQEQQFRIEIASAVKEAYDEGFREDFGTAIVVEAVMNEWMEKEDCDLDVDTMEIILAEEVEKIL